MIPFVNLAGQRNAYRHEFEIIERNVMDSGCFIGGSQIQNLEKELSDYVGKSAITCGSGTDALTIALMTLDLKPGDQVIVPDFTFVAPAECVRFLGGTPIFADIDKETLQINPAEVEPLINKKTVGIIAVDLFGQCAAIERLRKIASKRGLWIIEDAAQAFGATRNAGGTIRNAATLGDISITSFYPTKPLGCYGDGGALFTDDRQLEETIRLITNHGSIGHYDHHLVGLNSRLDALQAAILRVKLSHLKEELAVRRQNATKYNNFFTFRWNPRVDESLRVTPQRIDTGNESTFAQYTLLAENREVFIAKLKQAEIPYCIHYPKVLQKQPCFFDILSLQSKNENASNAVQKVISLPVCAFTDVSKLIEHLDATI